MRRTSAIIFNTQPDGINLNIPLVNPQGFAKSLLVVLSLSLRASMSSY